METRGRRAYYYRKKRQGSRVRSIYAGSGPLAILALKHDTEERQRRQAERNAMRASMETETIIDRRLAEAESKVKAIVRAALKAAGYHQHKGTWRKKRT